MLFEKFILYLSFYNTLKIYHGIQLIKHTKIYQWPNPNLNRKERTAINHLRIGHTRLTHKFLMTKEEPPQCTTCGVIVTVKHLITECFKYTEDALQH